MTNKEKYKFLCETEGAGIPLFLQYWWWEAVCRGKRWDVLLAERRGRVCGAWPHLCGRKLGLRYVLQPQMTMFSGPWLADGTDGDVLDELLLRFAARRDAVAMVRCAPSFGGAEAFVRHGWRETERHSFRFERLLPLQELMTGASQLRRRDFGRNAERLTLDWAVPPAEMAALHDSQYRRQGQRDLLHTDFMTHVAAEAVAHGNGVVAGVRDANGVLHAAVFVAYDSRCAYLLLLARGAEAPRNAMAYLVWRTVEWLTPRTQMFDFEGGAEEGVGEYYRSFGAQPVAFKQFMRCRLPLADKILGL